MALNKIAIKFDKKFNRALSQSNMKKWGKTLVDDIVRRTRLGFGVKGPDKAREKLKPLRKFTIELRKKYRNKMIGLTKPSKSNLTFTGQLLDSLKSDSPAKGVITLLFKGIHRNLDGSTMKNEDLAFKMSIKEGRRAARPFLGPTNREIQRLKNTIEKEIIRSIR